MADFAAAARSRRDWVLEQATDKILDDLMPDGLPDDLASMLKDQGSFFLVWLEAAFQASAIGQAARTSSAAQKLTALAKKVPSMERALKAIASNGIYEPVRRMLLVAEANNLDLERSPMRIVDVNLTPYQAQTQCAWAGTFAEFRTGSVMTGAADPRGHFAIYFPSERRALRGSMVVTRVSCEYQ